MNIKDFKGKKYDYEKLENYGEKVEEKIAAIEEKNAKKWEKFNARWEKMTEKEKETATRPHEDGYCTFCGAVRPSGEIGIGKGCEEICEQFKKGYIDLFCSEKIEEWKNMYFNAYKRYAKYCRALFLHNNKKARNDFLKSFFISLENNKEARLSKKQIEIIERNAEYKQYSQELEKYKKFVFFKFCNYYKMLFYMDLNSDRDFALYCRIQYAKAWI